jgi:hypothetical protein
MFSTLANSVILAGKVTPCALANSVTLNDNYHLQTSQTVDFSLQANYADRQPPFVDKVSINFCGEISVAWSAQRVPTATNISFLDRGHYFAFK